jgi:alanyl-tRNA synthetase
LTALIARENGLTIDEAGFKAEMEEQRNRSREAAKVDAGDWILVGDDQEAVVFVGYDQLETQTHIQRYRAVKSKQKDTYQLVLQETPFYAESGGQVGDVGHLVDASGRKINVLNTIKDNNLIIHEVDQLPQSPTDLMQAVVDKEKRKETAANHSATHLLHAALRNVLGSHVEQKGSLVHPDYLRFDFSHFAKMSTEELNAVETEVNSRIMDAITLTDRRAVPISEAIALGAMALFGEKYGDFVRVIAFDPAYSLELCGGTHVPNTAHIGLFKIISESSVATGVRRIEAISGAKALRWMQEQFQLLQQLKETFKSPKDLVAHAEKLLEESSQLRKQIELMEQEQLQQVLHVLKAKFKSAQEAMVIAERVDVRTVDGLKRLTNDLRKLHPNAFVVLGAVVGDKPQLAVGAADEMVQTRNLNAGHIVREAAKAMQGGGGGQPNLATAGGSNKDGLNEAMALAVGLL